MILLSPRHLFANFLVKDTYTHVISRFHEQIMDFTLSADVLSTKFIVMIMSENKNLFNLNCTLKTFGPKFLIHIGIVKPETLLHKF